MTRRACVVPGWSRSLIGLVALGLTGCPSRPDLDFAPPIPITAEWKPVSTSGSVVPGIALAAWKGPEGASLVLFRSLWIPGGDPAALAREYATRFENFPGVQVIAQGVVTVPGAGRAARIDLTGPGTGSAFVNRTGTSKPAEGDAPEVATYRVAVALPRSQETLWLLWHFPESARERVLPSINRLFETSAASP